MKKTCGALVIGLLITTNVFAKPTNKNQYCQDNLTNSVVISLKKRVLILNEWKPTTKECKELSTWLNSMLNKAYSLGASEALAAASQYDNMYTEDQAPTQWPTSSLPPITPTINTSTNTFKDQETLNDTERDGYVRGILQQQGYAR